MADTSVAPGQKVEAKREREGEGKGEGQEEGKDVRVERRVFCLFCSGTDDALEEYGFRRLLEHLATRHRKEVLKVLDNPSVINGKISDIVKPELNLDLT
ncbi:MAG: hypothetical protein QW334_04300 [Thermofilum sp.]